MPPNNISRKKRNITYTGLTRHKLKHKRNVIIQNSLYRQWRIAIGNALGWHAAVHKESATTGQLNNNNALQRGSACPVHKTRLAVNHKLGGL